MKKILAVLLVAAMAVSTAACTSENATSSSSSSLSSSSVSSSSSSESSSASFEESSQESSAVEVSEENQKLGDIIEASRTEEDNEYYKPVMSKEDPAAQILSDILGFNFEDMESFAIAASAINVKAYGVAIIKPVEGKEQAVLDGVNNFVQTQRKSFENYLPDQGEIANAATVDQLDDGTVVLVMCENGSDVREKILSALQEQA